MLDKELFVMGVDDPKTGYRRVHHLGEIKEVKMTYDAMLNTANKAGLNKNALFLLPFPPDDEVVEKCKLTKSFLQWLNEETKPLVNLIK